MVRLNGGELLIDLTQYGNLNHEDNIVNSLSEDIKKSILDNGIFDENDYLVDIKKPLIIKLYGWDYRMFLTNCCVLDDSSITISCIRGDHVFELYIYVANHVIDTCKFTVIELARNE